MSTAADDKRQIQTEDLPDGDETWSKRKRRISPAENDAHDDGNNSNNTSNKSGRRQSGSACKKKPRRKDGSANNDEINLDIVGKIAGFMDSNKSLLSLLVAVGPLDSRKIRHDYLRNNEAYLVKSLHMCKRAMAPAIQLNQPNSSNVLNLYQRSEEIFRKCRDNITAWMEINTDWRSRCTVANMKRYRRPYMEANLIFNKFVVAIEVGLVEVFDHLVNEMDADVCDTECKGFVADVASSHRGMDNFVFNPIIVALYRKDTEILQVLLKSKTFRTESSSDARRTLRFEDILDYCFKRKQIGIDAFEILYRARILT